MNRESPAFASAVNHLETASKSCMRCAHGGAVFVYLEFWSGCHAAGRRVRCPDYNPVFLHAHHYPRLQHKNEINVDPGKPNQALPQRHTETYHLMVMAGLRQQHSSKAVSLLWAV